MMVISGALRAESKDFHKYLFCMALRQVRVVFAALNPVHQVGCGTRGGIGAIGWALNPGASAPCVEAFFGKSPLERAMQLTVARKRDGLSANGLARDWAALGRSVQRLALEAIALHFATVGALEVAAREELGSSDGDARVDACVSDLGCSR
jgi:hypothetical protein